MFAGTGIKGNSNGVAAKASFSSPSGLACAGSTLYVADTDNNVVRVIANGEQAQLAPLPRFRSFAALVGFTSNLL